MDREQRTERSASGRFGLRWRWWSSLVVGAAAGAFALGACTGDSTPELPVRHVILVSFDTTRRDHFGCYGNSWIQTPHVDALAGESILFTDCITVITTTLASHTSLFTGKYPHSHGVPRNGFVVSGENVMLPEILEEAGLTTAGFIASFALDRLFDFNQGFHHFDQEFDIESGTQGADQSQRSADRVTDSVIEFLDQDQLPESLFLFVHYFDPHSPYTSPPPYDTMYGVGEGPHAITVRDHPSFSGVKRTRVQRELILDHAGEVSYMDEQFGRLLDSLRERGILDEAILIVTSDHGENLKDAPGVPFNHGSTVYGPEIRAVCMVRLPNAERGGTEYAGPISNIDLLPTLTSYLGLPTPAGIDGEALDLLDLPASPELRTRFAESSKPWEEAETDPRWFNARKAQCALRASFKYVRALYLGTEELFDLSTDPGEKKNLLLEPAPRTRAIADNLREALTRWGETAEPLPTQFDTTQREETIKRLKGLGYLGGDDSDPKER